MVLHVNVGIVVIVSNKSGGSNKSWHIVGARVPELAMWWEVSVIRNNEVRRVNFNCRRNVEVKC